MICPECEIEVGEVDECPKCKLDLTLFDENGISRLQRGLDIIKKRETKAAQAKKAEAEKQKQQQKSNFWKGLLGGK